MRKLAPLFLFLVPFAFGADKHPWASFKPGSYAKLKTTSSVAGTKTVTEMTQTLVSVDANNAVIEIETKMMGQTTKTKTNIPLKSATPAGAQQAKAPAQTSETVQVAGKSIAAKCVDMDTNANGMQTSTHACTSDTVPGSLVKSTSKTSGAVKMESVTELVEFAAK